MVGESAQQPAAETRLVTEEVGAMEALFTNNMDALLQAIFLYLDSVSLKNCKLVSTLRVHQSLVIHHGQG